MSVEHDSGCSTPNKALSVHEAAARICAAVRPATEAENVTLSHSLGRVLARAITAPHDVPPQDNSAMDGYAVNAQDLGEHTLNVVGTALAGHPYAGAVAGKQCVRIMTGAVLPPGCDTVIMQEHVERDGDVIRFNARHMPGQNVRRAGEDLTAGEIVLHRGRQMNPADLGLLASLGIAQVPVIRRLRVAYFSTGDELRAVDEPLAPGDIHDSNRYTIGALLTRLGVEPIDLGVVRDKPGALRAAFHTAAFQSDAIITTGGVSVGDADYVRDVLAAEGHVDLWRVEIRPGRPFAFGHLQHALFFGLPGNPVSAMVTFLLLVQPALRKLMGAEHIEPLTLRVPCASPLKKTPGRQEYQRGILSKNADGETVVHSTGLQGSGVLSSMSRADCFIVLPAAWGDVSPGTLVDIQPFYN